MNIRSFVNLKRRKKLSEWKFRDIFNTKFNLGFHPKKVDTCRTCDRFQVLLQSESPNSVKREEIMKQKEYHLQLVDSMNQNFRDAINIARDEISCVEIFTFDLQRGLELPSITTSEAFYRRQLWCYNLCIFDEKRKCGYMYFWNETIASRGAQEISSCLFKHFTNNVSSNTKKIILYSDACSRPSSTLESIEQRFFVSGHSFNSCDRCFGVIERQKKVTEMIFVPQHWINIIFQAKKTEPTFKVIEMNRADFFSCKHLENIITNRKYK